MRTSFTDVNCGNSSVGRAQPCQGWGREFEPRFPLQFHIIKHYCGNSSVGRARPCQGRGREFEPRFPLQTNGVLAKRLCTGLQIHVARFDSGTRLHNHAVS